jgi:TATA-box binding protein (TBP) (component of TFIID and TFIIIB)
VPEKLISICSPKSIVLLYSCGDVVVGGNCNKQNATKLNKSVVHEPCEG